MGIFQKKTVIYQEKGQKAHYRAVKEALKNAGISGVSGSVWSDEPPVCGCGAKLDVRDFGPNGKIDRDIYTIRVPEESAENARGVVAGLFPDYQAYVPYTKK